MYYVVKWLCTAKGWHTVSLQTHHTLGTAFDLGLHFYINYLHTGNTYLVLIQREQWCILTQKGNNAGIIKSVFF